MKKILLCMAIALSLPTICMAKKTLVLIGDASMAPHSIANPDVRGCGEMLSNAFTDKVEMVNFAQAGESTHTLVEKRLVKILEQCNSGDYVLLQLGQNDLRDENGGMYYSIAEMTTQLMGVVEKMQKKRLKVILCTPLAQPYYQNGQIVDRMGGYAEVIRRVAQIKKTYLLDLERVSKEWLNTIGRENAQLFFKNISQETQRREYLLTENGATEVSRMVAKEIQTQKIPFLKNHLVLPQ